MKIHLAKISAPINDSDIECPRCRPAILAMRKKKIKEVMIAGPSVQDQMACGFEKILLVGSRGNVLESSYLSIDSDDTADAIYDDTVVPDHCLALDLVIAMLFGCLPAAIHQGFDDLHRVRVAQAIGPEALTSFSLGGTFEIDDSGFGVGGSDRVQRTLEVGDEKCGAHPIRQFLPWRQRANDIVKARAKGGIGSASAFIAVGHAGYSE
jgi:hypothetical protein